MLHYGLYMVRLRFYEARVLSAVEDDNTRTKRVSPGTSARPDMCVANVQVVTRTNEIGEYRVSALGIVPPSRTVAHGLKMSSVVGHSC